MNYVTLNDGTQVPSLGMGTWYLGAVSYTHLTLPTIRLV